MKLTGCSLVTRLALGAVDWPKPASRLAADVLISSTDALGMEGLDRLFLSFYTT